MAAQGIARKIHQTSMAQPGAETRSSECSRTDCMSAVYELAEPTERTLTHVGKWPEPPRNP